MKSTRSWLTFVLSVSLGMVMVCFGVVFLRSMCFCFYLSRGEAVFSSFLLGVLLLLVGGGLLSSTIVRLKKEVRQDRPS
jgi:uncharacterized membrane protein YidH (DUF202 family)